MMVKVVVYELNYLIQKKKYSQQIKGKDAHIWNFKKNGENLGIDKEEEEEDEEKIQNPIFSTFYDCQSGFGFDSVSDTIFSKTFETCVVFRGLHDFEPQNGSSWNAVDQMTSLCDAFSISPPF